MADSYLTTLITALAWWPVPHKITADDVRAALDAAQVPENARGGIFCDAADKGYLERLPEWKRTQHRIGRGHLLRVYRVTEKARSEARGKRAA